MPQLQRRPPRIVPDLRSGFGVVGLGDSIVAGSGAGGVANKFFDLACILSDQRIPFLDNAGASGETIQDVMARIEDDVVPLDPSHCVVCCGTNNLGDDDFDGAVAAYAAGIQRLRGAGIEPVICLPPPRSAINDNAKLYQNKLMLWLRTYARHHGIVLADLYTPLANPLTGEYDTGMGNPSEAPGYVHPSVAGSKLMAQALVTALSDAMPAGGVYLATTYGGPDTDVSLIPDGNFAIDTNADGVANNWFGTSSGGTVTFSRQADAGGRYWQRMAVTSAPASASLSRPIPTPWAVGDELELSFRLRTSDNQSGDGGFLWRFDWGGGSPSVSTFYDDFPYDVDDGIVCHRAIVPTGTTNAAVRWSWQQGTFVLDITQVTVVNRTTYELAEL